jgi:hypothetical protein
VCFILAINALPVLIPIFRLSKFSFSLEDKSLRINQGLFTRKELNLPYGTIQEVTVKRSLLDRLFNLASVSVLNASQAGSSVDEYGKRTWIWHGIPIAPSGRSRRRIELLGCKGNMVHIPGLLPADAETLKTAFLSKMKEHGEENSGSGL